jgi:hypothetical protein
VADRQDVIAAIDTKIAEMQQELERLRRAAELIPLTEANLEALQRTRALFLGEHIQLQETGEVRRSNLSHMIPAGSTGGMTLEILREAGRPLHISELMRELRAKGSKSSQDTVTGMLSRYITNKYVKRVATSTYALGDKPASIRGVAPTISPSETNLATDLSENDIGTNHESGQFAEMNESQGKSESISE